MSDDALLKRLAWALFGLFYVAFLVRYGLGYLDARFIDLPSFYFAADAVFNQGLSPYKPTWLAEQAARVGVHSHPFLYPPTALLPLYPLALAPSYAAAAHGLLLVNHVALLGICWLVLQGTLPPDWRKRGIPTLAGVGLVAYLMLFQAVPQTLAHGQVNLLTVLLLCLLWRLLRARRVPIATALALSLAVLLKTYPGIFLALLVVKRRWVEVIATLALLIMAVGLSYVVLPGSLWSDWLGNVAATGLPGRVPAGFFSPASPHNLSLNAFFARLFLENQWFEVPFPAPRLARSGAYVANAAVVGISIWASLSATRRRGDQLLHLEFALFLATSFLVVPLSWPHHLLYVLPGIPILLCHAASARPRRWGMIFAVTGCALGLFRMLPLDAGRGIAGVIVASIPLYCVLVLWATMIHALFEASRGTGAGQWRLSRGTETQQSNTEGECAER